MATEAQNTMPLGTPAPDFTLPDVVTGADFTLSASPQAKALLVAFICRHCPYVVHIRPSLLEFARAYPDLQIVTISSNDAVAYPEDSPEKLREMALELALPFPFLYDESQDVARAYDAQCTPDFFLFDAKRQLTYRGRLDDSTPGNGKPVTGNDLRPAIEATLAAQPVAEGQRPSLGCSIKWKKA